MKIRINQSNVMPLCGQLPRQGGTNFAIAGNDDIHGILLIDNKSRWSFSFGNIGYIIAMFPRKDNPSAGKFW
jgi:hypothetical protein